MNGILEIILITTCFILIYAIYLFMRILIETKLLKHKLELILKESKK